MKDITIIAQCKPPELKTPASDCIYSLMDAIANKAIMFDEARDEKGRRCYLVSFPKSEGELNGLRGIAAAFIGVIYDVPVGALLKEITPVSPTITDPETLHPDIKKTYN